MTRGHFTGHRLFGFAAAAVLVLAIFPLPLRAEWFDAQWQFRRAVNVNWDTEHPGGDELGIAEFYAAGHAAADGSDIRVTTADGKLIASHVLMAGPGDFFRVVFALRAPGQNYYVYFGNPHPTAPPKGLEDVQYHAGLLMEMRRLDADRVNGFSQMEEAWADSPNVIGKTLINAPFIGGNPFGDESHTISKISGSLFAPIDGSYDFAGACENKGALYIDGNRVLFIPFCPGDTRFHARVDLTRGPHDFLLCQADTGGELRVSIVWRRPDMGRFKVIERDSFGSFSRGNAGPLEQIQKSITADFTCRYLGECLVNDRYAHRCRFTVAARAAAAEDAKVNWDFGDGQSAAGDTVEHVFLTSGVYPVRVTVHRGDNSDTQTILLPVHRDWPNLAEPSEDDPATQSNIAATYDVDSMPLNWLGPASMLHLAAGNYPPMLAAAERLASAGPHADRVAALNVLKSISDGLIFANRPDDAISVWSKVPADSDLQPQAARSEASLCLWWPADFDKAVSLLQPLGDGADDDTRRVLGEALVLSGKADEGSKILNSLEAQWPSEKIAAMSGAMARTIESLINDRDCENGEKDWELWTANAPATFLEGYSVVLRTKLMELRHDDGGAAKVAEAFANAVPDSSYAPMLLDRASKLLASTDPQKSADLRQTLKSRYPEDPLSQDEPAK